MLRILKAQLYKTIRMRGVAITALALVAVILLFFFIYPKAQDSTFSILQIFKQNQEQDAFDSFESRLLRGNADLSNALLEFETEYNSLITGLKNNQNELEFFKSSNYTKGYADYTQHLLGILNEKINTLQFTAQTALQSGQDNGLSWQFEQADELFLNIKDNYFSLSKPNSNVLLFKREGLTQMPEQYLRAAQSLQSLDELFERVRQAQSIGNTEEFIALAHSISLPTELNQILAQSMRGGVHKKTCEFLIKNNVCARLQARAYNLLNDFTSYEQIKNEFRAIKSEQNALNELLRSTSVLEVFKQNNVFDRELFQYKGMLFSSRYALKEQAARAKYTLLGGEALVEPAQLKGGWGFMRFSFVIVAMIIVVLSIVLAASLSGDFALARLELVCPNKRKSLLFAKICAPIIVAAVFCIFAFMLCLCLAPYFGFEQAKTLVVFNASYATALPALATIIIQYICLIVGATMYILISTFMCCLMRSRAAAIGITLALYFAALVLNPVLSRVEFYKYLVFNNTELSPYFIGGSILNGQSLQFSLALYAVYALAFIALSHTLYTKRDI